MTDLSKIVSLCKRRGFIYPGSEIYGGLANTYDYGPMGVELFRNIKNLWWTFFVSQRTDMYGLDTNILMNPKVWEASGHTASFSDTIVDCKNCQNRTRADHLIEDHFAKKNEEKEVEGLTSEELTRIIKSEYINCPVCGKKDWTPARKFNLLFETHIGIVAREKSLAYLRGEIAQGMFVNFKNVLETLSPKLPFGLAQSGACFRNEVTLGKFMFRTLQFNLAELEYFFDPEKQEFNELFEYWKKEMWTWTTEMLKLNPADLRWRPHTDEERAHYSTRTEDIEYQFPFGFKEMYGLAYRTDFDLKNHMEKSGMDLRYRNQMNNKQFIPHVIEPTFGMDRSFLAVLFDTYTKEENTKGKRIYLKLPAYLAPYQAAVFPLVANKENLVAKAKSVFDMLKIKLRVAWDERGNIGKRYFAQDEIGTPFCLTVDYQTLEDNTLTIRHRDTTKQERVPIDQLPTYLAEKTSIALP